LGQDVPAPNVNCSLPSVSALEVRFAEIIHSSEATCPTSPHPGVEAIARGDPFLKLLGWANPSPTRDVTGILKLDAGDVAGAVQALTDSASALQQYRAGRRLREAPRMLLAKRLFQAGQSARVLAYLAVCAQFEYPGGEEYTDEGRNPRSPRK
jgi:hypothetical protein